MKRTEAVDKARKAAAAGHTAYICYNKDGDLCLNERPSGTVVLIVEPDCMFSRVTLISLLTHRMRLTKMPGVAYT